jgi:hypothetical protein
MFILICRKIPQYSAGEIVNIGDARLSNSGPAAATLPQIKAR